MERLTRKMPGGRYGLVEEKELGAVQLTAVINRLGAYEDTGFSPEDVIKAFSMDAILELAGQMLGTTPERITELVQVDKRGMVLVARFPIGTTVYQIRNGEREEVRIIDGEEYTRRVPDWYVTQHEYGWIDAMTDAQFPDRENKPHCRYFLTKEEAIAERDRINAGGDPFAFRHTPEQQGEAEAALEAQKMEGIK